MAEFFTHVNALFVWALMVAVKVLVSLCFLAIPAAVLATLFDWTEKFITLYVWVIVFVSAVTGFLMFLSPLAAVAWLWS